MSLRPFVTRVRVADLLKTCYGFSAITIEELESSSDRNFKVTCSDSTFNGESEVQPYFYILKIINHIESENKALQASINTVQDYLLANGIRCSTCIRDLQGADCSYYQFPTGTENGTLEMCLVKLLTYLDGKPLGECELVNSPRVSTDLGTLLARFHTILQECVVEHLDVSPDDPWALENPLVVLEYITATTRRAAMVTAAIQDVDKKLWKVKDYLPKGIIHGDFHDLNLIYKSPNTNNRDNLNKLHVNNVDNGAGSITFTDKLLDIDTRSNGKESDSMDTIKEQDARDVDKELDRILQTYGIIDLNGVSYSYLVLELGRLIGDQMVGIVSKFTSVENSSNNDNVCELLKLATRVLSGYLSVRKLNSHEWEQLYWSITLCFCQYLVMGEYNKQEDPHNIFAHVAVEESLVLIEIWTNISPCFMLENITALLQKNLGPDFNH